MKWPDIIQTVSRQYGEYFTDDEVAALSFDESPNRLGVTQLQQLDTFIIV